QVSEQANATAARKLITVSSDVLKLTLDTQGGDVVSAELLSHKLEEGKDQPFVLLTSQPEHLYIAQSGLVGRNGPDS
ncbi:membrane protein insertase YidC, partial [Escherichia coli]|nr:membrane protein insertase YidC [Escherichia coli]